MKKVKRALVQQSFDMEKRIWEKGINLPKYSDRGASIRLGFGYFGLIQSSF